MGWNRRDAVGELVREGDHVKVFRHNTKYDHEVVGDYVGEVVRIIAIESHNYEGVLQICLDFGDGKSGWAHQSSVMKV